MCATCGTPSAEDPAVNTESAKLQTHRQTDRKTGRKRDRRERGRKKERNEDRQTEGETEKKEASKEGKSERKTGRQTGREAAPLDRRVLTPSLVARDGRNRAADRRCACSAEIRPVLFTRIQSPSSAINPLLSRLQSVYLEPSIN